jgi:hypothetical protein
LRILLFADAGKDLKPMPIEHAGARAPDAARGAGDHDGAAGWLTYLQGICRVIRLGSPGVPVVWRICLRRACGWRLDNDGAQGAHMPTSGTASG